MNTARHLLPFPTPPSSEPLASISWVIRLQHLSEKNSASLPPRRHAATHLCRRRWRRALPLLPCGQRAPWLAGLSPSSWGSFLPSVLPSGAAHLHRSSSSPSLLSSLCVVSPLLPLLPFLLTAGKPYDRRRLPFFLVARKPGGRRRSPLIPRPGIPMVGGGLPFFLTASGALPFFLSAGDRCSCEAHPVLPYPRLLHILVALSSLCVEP